MWRKYLYFEYDTHTVITYKISTYSAQNLMKILNINNLKWIYTYVFENSKNNMKTFVYT